MKKYIFFFFVLFIVLLTACSTRQNTDVSKKDISVNREDGKTFLINHQPEELNKKLAKLEVEFKQISDNNRIRIIKNIYSNTLNSDYNIIIDNPKELSKNEYVYCIGFEIISEDGEQILHRSNLTLYYQIEERAQPLKFYLEFKSELQVDPIDEVQEIPKELNEECMKMNDFLVNSFEKMLIDYFSLPKLDYNNPTFEYSNGKLSKVYVEGGGFESHFYVYEKNTEN
ncbi:hypothetical protein SAMN02745135_00851 [Caloranaerobacter azorensis DSM 13643]|uniref:Lipoprotein n=1 Tax=Caloranaerobacter azorensis DSM 13643 TaxID=1121264 RepID=A0A1M5T413_9FIRM|nr:hypothetical protein [Caloranaerobacter azorensis]SHH45350.1 hypothetical protein SAMN02745135_00851 [Caloranaerobacter azorensis DSM 13643]